MTHDEFCSAISLASGACHCVEARRLVDKQALDAGLWFVPETAAEAYLQQELRRLHAAVEGSPVVDRWGRTADDAEFGMEP